MYRLSTEFTFSAAHRLKIDGHKCENLHGHNWRVIVTVESELLNEYGMVIDFYDLKKIAKAEVDRLDHCYINEVPPFTTLNPTTENLCKFLAQSIQEQLPSNIRVYSIRIYESARNSGEYFPS